MGDCSTSPARVRDIAPGMFVWQPLSAPDRTACNQNLTHTECDRESRDTLLDKWLEVPF